MRNPPSGSILPQYLYTFSAGVILGPHESNSETIDDLPTATGESSICSIWVPPSGSPPSDFGSIQPFALIGPGTIIFGLQNLTGSALTLTDDVTVAVIPIPQEIPGRLVGTLPAPP